MLKQSKEFMLEDERVLLVKELAVVNQVVLSTDKDTTVYVALEKIHQDFYKNFELFFANGGDQNNESIPEVAICQKVEIGLLDGLGAKIQSSSWLLKK